MFNVENSRGNVAGVTTKFGPSTNPPTLCVSYFGLSPCFSAQLFPCSLAYKRPEYRGIGYICNMSNLYYASG